MIRKLIEKFFSNADKTEQNQPQELTPNSVLDIRNKIVAKKGDISLDNANFGVQIHNPTIHLYPEQPTSSQILTSSISTKLDEIQKLVSVCKFDEALTEYHELLGDYSVMNALDKNLQSRIILGVVSVYINTADFANAGKFIERHKRDKLLLDEKGYSIIVSYYLNQNNPDLYEDAERVSSQALADFPQSLTCMCLYAFAKSIVDTNFDGKQYLDTSISPLNDEKDKKLYYETICNIFGVRRNYSNIITVYNELDFLPSMQLHAQYIHALYASVIYNKEKEIIVRADIDFSELFSVWQAILEIEKIYSDDEVSFFRRLIADVYLNCVVLLGRESSQIPKDILTNASEETKDNYSFWLSVCDDSKTNFIKSDEVILIENWLESEKYVEIHNYLWPAIMSNEKLQRFRYLLLSICIEMRNENPTCFVECISHFKKVGLFDDHMKLIECAYIYRTESKQRALKDLESLYIESKDPIIILELVRFTYDEGEITFAADKLEDIKQTKPFVISIEPNRYFKLRYRHYVDSQKDGKIFALLDDISSHTIDTTLKLRIDIAKAEYVGDLPVAAMANLQLYEQTDDISFLYRSCEISLSLYDTQQLEQLFSVIIKAKHADKISIELLHAYYYVLANKPDKALDAAKIAKDLSADLPNSPAHQLYWSLCFRYGNGNDIHYIGEYTSKYPTHTQWVRSIQALEKDNDGNDTLTSEIIQIFNDYNERYIAIMQMYKNQYAYGVSMLKGAMQWRFSDVANKLTVLKTFSGEAKIFDVERKKKINQVAVDSFTLYFTEKLGCLELLRHCEKIYIDYQTVTVLSGDLLANEDEHIRNIIHFIKTSSNIVFVCPSQQGMEIKSKFHSMEEPQLAAFSCLVNSCIIANDNNVPFVYFDMVTQPLATITNTDTISLLAFMKSAHTLKWLSDTEFGQLILKASELNFAFMNISSLDLYNALLSTGFVINDSISNLIKIPITAEVASCVSMFIGVLLRLRADGKYDILENIAFAFLTALDKRHGRTRHEWHSKETLDRASYDRVGYTRLSCEMGFACICGFLLDSKSPEAVNALIKKIAIRIPKEYHIDIFDKAKEIHSTYLTHS